MPTMKPRQFQAVTIKNWTLLYQSWCGMFFCFVVAILIVVLVGWLHAFYESSYDPIDNNSTEMAPVPMPIESQPSNINHRILISLQSSVNSKMKDPRNFGTMPENTTGTGYLGAADMMWSEQGAAQIRASFAIPAGAKANVNQSSIPFVQLGDIECPLEDTEPCTPANLSTSDLVDVYENSTAYALMAEDIQAEHSANNTTTYTWQQRILESVKSLFAPKWSEQSIIVSDNDTNLSAQFLWDKHENLFTSGLNFSYLSYPINRILSPVSEAGWDYTISSYTSHQTQLDYNLTNFFHFGGTQYFMYQLFMRNTFTPQSGSEPPLIKGYYKQFWELYQDSGADPFTPIFSCLLIPIAFYIIIPMFSYQMSQEKGDGLLSLQQMMGLRYYPRYLADLVYQLVISLVLYGVIIGGCAIAQMEFITTTYAPIWLFSTLLFVMNIPMLSQLLSSFTDSGRVSSILGIFVVLIEAVVGIVWSSAMYDQSITNRTVNMWFALVPGMGPIVCLVMINGLIVTQNPGNYLVDATYFSISKNPDGSMMAAVGYEIACALLIGYLSLVLYAFISIYIDRITPRRNGIPEHPCFFMQAMYERASVRRKKLFQEITWGTAFWALGQFIMHPSIMLIPQQEIDQFVITERHRSEEKQQGEEDTEVSSSTHQSSTTFDYLKGGKDASSIPTTNAGEKSQSQHSGGQQAKQAQREFRQQNRMSLRDPDLETEKQLTIQGMAASNGQRPLVRLLNLKKTYPATRYTPEKQAVKSVYYTIGENECLCLLGANGCGKTTQINMLCMLFKPTSGTAYICGKSITDRRSQQFIQSNLGVCPQFDILYPTMTIRQHLRFYARIKGVDKDIIEEHISDLLEAVELTDKQNHASKKLSGGMKRRLSISIALCSKPKVLVFDEPSSGLDVATRRQLWNVIIKARQSHAVLLTTHAMEEAECLSTRIAIMAEGKIRCIGTVQQLQRKFGSGYQLTVCVDKENVQKGDPVYVGSVYLASRWEQMAHAKITQKIDAKLTLVSCYQGQLVYIVPENTVVSELFGKMEALVKDQESGICDWGLNQTSLESVFMRVVSQSY